MAGLMSIPVVLSHEFGPIQLSLITQLLTRLSPIDDVGTTCRCLLR
jgi:hypothetical protein